MLKISRHVLPRHLCQPDIPGYLISLEKSLCVSRTLRDFNMKGILVSEFGGPENLVLKSTLQKPSVGKNDVLINVKAHGVNPVDTYLRSGVYPKLPQTPYIPGKDGAGIVTQVGSNVKNFKEGDRVFGSRLEAPGFLAEFCSVEESTVFHLPSTYSFDEGAALGIPYLTAYRALFICSKISDLSGKRVLIHGASGNVGQACIQFAKSQAQKVVGTAGTDAGLKIIKEAGVDDAYNHSKEDYVSEMKSHGEKFDLIIEMLANVNLGTDLELLNAKGIIVIVGCRGEICINPRLLMAPETSIVGCAVTQTTKEEYAIMGNAIADGMQAGWVKPRISKVYTLDQCSQAHDDVINQKGINGKLVVRMED